jgi:iron complex outermembrane receptor protein
VKISTAFLPTVAGGLSLALLAGGKAAAAEATSDEGLQLEEVVVTATKVATEASKTPIALSVYSDEALKKDGIVNIDTLGNISPSVNIAFGGPTGARGANVAIRGVYTTDNTSKGEQAISFNLDGVPIGRPQVMQMAFYDIERVEVLRGPQGTLYGKSSTGGAINVITARPKGTFDWASNFEVGDFNTRRADAMVNIPVSDGFAVRAAASTNKRDGYLNPVLYADAQHPVNGERPLNDEDNTNGRLSGLWTIGDTGDFLFTASAGHIGGMGNSSGNALFSRYKLSGSQAREVYYNPMASGVDDHYSNFSGELNLNLGAVHLTYVGGHLSFTGNDDSSPSTWMPTPAGGLNYYDWAQYIADNKYDSHELRISNAQPQRLEYVLGANYWREKTDETDMHWHTTPGPTLAGTAANGFGDNNQTSLDCPLAAPNVLPVCSSPSPNIVSRNQHEAKAVFGQVHFSITDALKLTAGLRYSSDSTYRKGTIVAGPAPSDGTNAYWPDANGQPCHPGDPCVNLANGISGPVVQNDNGNQSASKVTWRVGADYQLTQSQMFYGYIATGYKAGSFNDRDPVTHQTAAYGPEDMTAYEVGYKGKIRPYLQFNSSAFYYDYKKFQLTQPTFFDFKLTGGNPDVVIYTTNVPVKIYGWENELQWNPTQNDLLSASVSLTRGTFSGGPNHAWMGFNYYLRLDWTGKDLDNLPHAVGLVAYEHRFPWKDGGYFSARLQSKISSSYYFTDNFGVVDGGPPFGDPNFQPVPGVFPFAGVHWGIPPQQYKQSAYTRTDFHLGYTSGSGKFEVDAYVRNLENKMQIQGPPSVLNAVDAGASADTVSIAVNAPRTMGVRLSVRY